MSPQTSLGWVGIRSRCLDTLDNCCFEFFNGTTSQMVSKKIKKAPMGPFSNMNSFYLNIMIVPSKSR